MKFRKRPIDPVAGEQAFLERVYSRMKPLLHRLILSQGATESEAEDILRVVFARTHCRGVTRDEVHELVDKIYDQYAERNG